MTDAEICIKAARILESYMAELKILRADTSSLKQIAFLESQLENIPGALFLLGSCAGRDSLKRMTTPEQLADFDAQQAR